MAVYELTDRRGSAIPLSRPAELTCFALIVAHAVYLAASYLQGSWLIAPDGGGVPTDFVSVWAAGRLVLEGHAAAAYDWPVHKAMEVTALGHPFAGYFGWHYPPTFLFIAAALSLMPYTAAYVLWAFGTFPAYLVAMRGIVGDRTGYFVAAAFPAVLCNFIDGQNGFLSAALFGGTLVLLPRRPLLAGVLLGLLTYKPHLGLLFPIVLAASGRWRTFGAASVTAALMAAAAWAAFGVETWQAFVGNIGHTSEAFLSDGWADWAKLQSAFGLARVLGAPEGLAWTVQIVLALSVAAAVIALWRSRCGLRDQGCRARRRRAAGDAVSLHLRPGGAGGAARLPVQARPRARILAGRDAGDRRRLPADPDLPLRQGAGRFRRRADRRRTGCASRAGVAERDDSASLRLMLHGLAMRRPRSSTNAASSVPAAP